MNDFHEAVLRVMRRIPAGRVVNYGRVALLAGYPGAARAIGNALHALDEQQAAVPWWRVINRAGRISTNCPTHTAQEQRRLLEAEGVLFNAEGYVSWRDFGWLETEDAGEFVALDLDERAPPGSD
jgi:methylated-DNA-protein-cysteine methyltransferase related protein